MAPSTIMSATVTSPVSVVVYASAAGEAAMAIVVQRPIASLKIACMTATGQMLPDDQRSQA